MAFGNDNPELQSSQDNGAQSDDDDDGYRTVTWIAFCSDSEISNDEIITLEENSTDTHLDPLSVDWESTHPVETIMVKSGKWDPGDTRIETFDVNGATSGTVSIGGGTRVNSEVLSEPGWCQGEGESGIQFEWSTVNLFFYETKSWDSESGETVTSSTSSPTLKPNISIIGGTVPDDPITQGAEEELSATLQNTGGEKGDIFLQLVINGDVVSERTVTVEAHSEKSISFYHIFTDTGTYEIYFNDVRIGSLEVVTTATTPSTHTATDVIPSETDTQPVGASVESQTVATPPASDDRALAPFPRLLLVIIASILGIAIYRIR